MSGREIIAETLDRIRECIPEERILRDEPMSLHTSFRTGGPADAFVIADNEEELACALAACADNGAGHMLLGNGSNVLVGDGGYHGIIIRLGDGLGGIEVTGSMEQEDGQAVLVRAGASKILSGISSFLTNAGLAGFEFASGIPGSLGGAVFMNAGAYGGEMKDIVQTVRLMRSDGSGVAELPGCEMDFGYRRSMLRNGEYVVLSAVLGLRRDAQDAIAARVAELQARRNAKQPVNYPSAGSTFKRPAGGFAAVLIDEAGLKGFRIGGAMVSEKHAGFIINAGGASTEDVLSVMRHVRSRVFENSGIMLEPEVRLVGCSL